jgi:hypothetical protein
VFKSLTTKAFNAAADFASGLWNGFKKGLGINSPSFIEEALFAIQNEALSTAKILKTQVGAMGLTTSPLLTTSLAPVGGTVQPPSQSFQWNQNGPLIGQAVIREEGDIEKLARRLEDRQSDRLAAAGRRQILRSS